MLKRAFLLLFCGFLVLFPLAACGQGNEPGATGALPSTPPATLPPAKQTLAPTPAPSVAAPGAVNLVVWLSDEFAQVLDVNAGAAMANAVAGFQLVNPSIRVSVLPKKSSGKGGIEDLLTTTQATLPQALPDVVTLDLRELPRFVKNGLAQPFDPQFSPSLQSDLYPFARQAGQADGRLYAIPFTADFTHAIYDSALMKTPPLNWTELFSAGIRYGFAAGGEGGLVGDSFLAQYVALGGRFSDASGRASLDRARLQDTLEFYRSAVAKSVAMTNTLSLKSGDDVWKSYLAVKVAIADVSAHTFLRERARLRNTGYAVVPTRDGNPATITRSWGYAITTPDPARRTAAQRFIEWMVSAENNASWNRVLNRVPVRRGALSAWSSDAAYRDFVNQALTAAVNRPSTTTGGALDAVLQIAVVDVLANNVSPSEAADKAITALSR